MNFMPTPTYAEKLKHPKWQKRRLEKMQGAGWHCEKCWETEKGNSTFITSDIAKDATRGITSCPNWSAFAAIATLATISTTE